MKQTTPIAAACVLALSVPALSAYAQETQPPEQQQQMQHAGSQMHEKQQMQHAGSQMHGQMQGQGTDQGIATRDKNFKSMSELRQNTVKASDILRGDITNGLNPMGTVKDLVLDKDARQVQYVIFNTGIPWTLDPGPGYLSWNVVDLEKGASFYGVDVRTDFDAGQVRGPEEIEITADEANYRLASRITDEVLVFPVEGGYEAYQIEDILIKPDTGEVTHFVIGTESDALFSSDRTAVPAERVKVENGELKTDLVYADLENMQDIDVVLLW